MAKDEENKEEEVTRKTVHSHCGEPMLDMKKAKVLSVSARRKQSKLGHRWLCNKCGHSE